MRINSMDYFRGAAIVIIVAGHCLPPEPSTFVQIVANNLIRGGSALFVFISGFFFHYIYSTRFNYSAFVRKKIRNVLTPYLLISLAGILWFVVIQKTTPFFHIQPSSTKEILSISLTYLLTGRFILAYWYIPFIMLIFLLSPLFIWQISLPMKVQVGSFLTLCGVSMIVHRPLENLSPLHSLIYYLPLYMLGIICSIQRVRVFEFIRGKSFVLGMAAFLTAVWQAAYFDTIGNFHKAEIFSYAGIDINFIQKIFLCLFFLALFNQFEEKEIPYLKTLAATSFAIYFIHPWILTLMSRTGITARITILPETLAFLLLFSVVLSISVWITHFVKKVFGDRSIYLIGY